MIPQDCKYASGGEYCYTHQGRMTLTEVCNMAPTEVREAAVADMARSFHAFHTPTSPSPVCPDCKAPGVTVGQGRIRRLW
jgi:hypothetical protein